MEPHLHPREPRHVGGDVDRYFKRESFAHCSMYRRRGVMIQRKKKKWKKERNRNTITKGKKSKNRPPRKM
jgi:hypothetical protein